MSKMDSAPLEGLLDWLAEEIAARLQTREASVTTASVANRSGHIDGPQHTAPEDLPAAGPGKENATAPPAASPEGAETPWAYPTAAGRAPTEAAATSPAATMDQNQAPATPEGPIPCPVESTPDAGGPPFHAARLLGRLTIALLVAVVLINIPLGWHGAALARIIPSSASVVVRNGLLVKESDKPDVYVYQAGKFRWITDLEVFQHYGYQWKNVQVVAPGFLASYEIGRPLYLVAKCQGSPHIYRLENGVKRWIVDIPTFEAEGYQWSDVQIMDCNTLAALPMGETIPPGCGPTPQP